jgi:molybdopterin converting factor subunit 1
MGKMQSSLNNQEIIAVNVIFFAALREKLMNDRVVIRMKPGEHIEQLIQQLINKYPAFANLLQNALTAINKEFADSDYILQDGDEVIFFPPVSGG